MNDRPGVGPLPNFFIIGAARAGTTSLSIWLHEHPEVFIPPAKELFFFDRDERWERGLSWYRQQFAGASGEPAIGEASTNYICSEIALQRMAEHVPDARLIAQLRNPVDRAYSHFCFATSWGAERRTFAHAVDDERNGHVPVPGCDYLARGRYRDQLEAVCRHFPRDALHVVVFEDMTRNPDPTYVEVCGFLDIDTTVRPSTLGTVANPSRRARSNRLWRATQRYRHALRPTGTRSSRLDELNSKSFPPLDPELRRGLLASFAADNRALESFLGRSLSDWRS